MPESSIPELITLSQAAARLGLRDARTVRRQLARHGIPVVRLGRSVRVERRALTVLIERAQLPVRVQPTAGTAKVRPKRRASAQPARMRRNGTLGASSGGRQKVESGLYRWHRKGCSASLEEGARSRCDCTFYCHERGENGEWNIVPMKAGTLKEARREKKERQSKPPARPHEHPPHLRLDEYFEDVFMAESDLSESTKRNYRSRWKNHVSKYLGHLRMTDVTRQDIDRAVKGLADEAKRLREKRNRPTPSFVENHMTPMKAVFTYAHATGYTRTNPTAKKRPPKPDPRRPGELPVTSPRRILDEQQYRAIVAWAKRVVAAGGQTAREALAIMFGLLLGLRISEAVAVIWSDIDREQRTIHISRQWNKEEQKLTSLKGTMEDRHLPLPRTLFMLLELLRTEEERRPDFDQDDFVTYRVNPRQVRSQGQLRSVFRRVQSELGIVLPDGFPIVFHGLRHTCATLLIRRNMPLIKVSEYLGHESVKVTQRVYTHLFAGDLAEVADALDAIADDDDEGPKRLATVEELIEDALGGDEAAAA